MKKKLLLYLKPIMANKILTTFIFLLALGLGSSIAQSPPIENGHLFSARYVKWPTNEPMPTSQNQLSLWLLNSNGFLDQSFTIPLYYDVGFQNMPHDPGQPTWPNALQAAVNAWNTVSNLAQFSTPQGLVQEQKDMIFEYPPKPTVFVDDEKKVFNLQPGRDERVALAERVIIANSLDCNAPGNWSGAVLVQGDIAINGNGDHKFFTGNFGNNDENTLETLLAHELGHLLGLNHYTGKKLRPIMRRIARKGKNQLPLSNDDEQMINRLYGHDGTLATADVDIPPAGQEFASSIPCDQFVPNIVAPLLTVSPTTSMMVSEPGYITSPCDNCVQDNMEEGINCGDESGCNVACETLCTGNTNSLHLTNSYYSQLENFNIVKNFIFLEPKESSITIEDGNFRYFKAGNKIEIKPSNGFSFSTGLLSTVELAIGDCDCPSICEINIPNVMTPNCDGINDFLTIFTNGADWYDFRAWNRNGNTVYHRSGPIGSDPIPNWGGVANNGNIVTEGVYSYILTLQSSCSGETKLFRNESNFHILDPNSCMENLQQNSASSPALSNNENIPNTSIDVFPSPFTNSLTVKSNRAIQSITVLSSEGKQVYSKKLSGFVTNYNLSLANLPEGMYFIQVVTKSETSSIKVLKRSDKDNL